MASKKKMIAICHYGGEFETREDGSLNYIGGEAYAVDLDENMQLSGFKQEIAETIDSTHVDAMIKIKYLLPGNKKNLITVSKDKDFQRMVNYYKEADQLELFIVDDESTSGSPQPNLPGSDIITEMTKQPADICIDIGGAPPPPPPSPNPPSFDLFNGSRELYCKVVVPLYTASITCDWEAAKALFDDNKNLNLTTCSLTTNGETALHVASTAVNRKYHVDFVKQLVAIMEKTDLELQNNNCNTALHLAAGSGSIKAVEIMAEKNRDLLINDGGRGITPMYVAAMCGKADMVKYLYNNSWKLHADTAWTPVTRSWVLLKCVENDMFDVALDIVTAYPELADGSVLGVLAGKPEAFSKSNSNIILRTIKSGVSGLKHEKEDKALELLKFILEQIVRKSREEILAILKGPPDNIQPPSRYSSRIPFVAAKKGNATLLVELIRRMPDMMFAVNCDNKTLFHVAIEYRQANVYSLINDIGSENMTLTSLQDVKGNILLHSAGMNGVPTRHEDELGAAIKMQQELIWFKEVETITSGSYRECMNKAGLKPYELFSREHKKLVAEGESWMRGSASQLMVIATLLAVMACAAAYTFPGGYKQSNDANNGTPVFLSLPVFTVFMIAQALDFFGAFVAMILFLSIHLSRFSEQDFLVSLPKKLILGLLALCFSTLMQIFSFSVGFFVCYRGKHMWIPVLLCILGTLVCLLYLVTQCHLLYDTARSTYDTRYMFKPFKYALYHKDRKKVESPKLGDQ